MKKLLLCALLLTATYSNLFAYLTNGNWRWRNNDGTEKTATWAAAQDSGITINDSRAIRLRFDVYNTQTSKKYYGSALEYATSVKGPWVPISTALMDNAFVLGGDNSYITDNQATTSQLTEPGYNFTPGRFITLSAAHDDSLAANERREYEWCIKPTANIMPNTTYYFRPMLRNGQINQLAILKTGSGFAIPPAILANGGFEQGMNNWQNTSATSDNTFAVEDTAVYEGNKALRVVVKTAGAPGSLQTEHAPFATGTTHTYLLRFWAKSGVDNAALTVGLQGASGTKTVNYLLISHWQRYQYAFKTTDPQTAIKFYFLQNTSYVLDDVTIQDETDPLVDVDMTYMWQNNRSGYGWLTGDGQESIKLPDGRVAWFFSDTWLGVNNTANNFTNTYQIINNDMVIQDGAPPNGNLTTYFAGTPASPQALMLPVTPRNAESWYWPRGPVIENNNIKVLLQEYDRPNVNTLPEISQITSVATISLSTLKVTKIEDFPFLSGTVQYNVILKGDDKDKYNYVYGGGVNSTSSGVARYPKDQLSASVPWEFLAADSTWVKDIKKAVPQPLPDGNSFDAVIRLDSNNYAAVFESKLTDSLAVVYSQHPYGPWSNYTVLYHIPALYGGLTYFSSIHEEAGHNGIYTLAYSSNTSINQMVTDKGTYQPHFVKADLKGLSPFTAKKSADSIITSSFASKDREAILYFTTANKDDTGFQIQNSTDGASWKTITSVAGGNSTKHTTKFELPHNGINYYRILLYDIDKKLTVSPVRKLNVVESATVSNFTATANSSKTDFTINTTSERFNHNFYIARSADGTTNWQQLLTMPGMGITNKPQAYAVSDNSPLPGKNYYRLVYYFNGKLAYSAIKLVDFTQNAISLTAYPNPTANNISFALKGYTGKQITVKLTSLYGKPLGTETFTVNSSGYYSLKTKPASSGTYLLTVSGDGLNKTSRVMVQ